MYSNQWSRLLAKVKQGQCYELADPTPAADFVKQKALVALRATGVQMQDQDRVCYPYSWVLLGKKPDVPSPVLCHPNSNLLWTVCICVQTHETWTSTPVYNSSWEAIEIRV